MNKHKRYKIVAVILLIAALVIIVVLGVNYSKNSEDSGTSTDIVEVPVQSSEELEELENKQAEFDKLSIALNEQDNVLATELSKKLAQDESSNIIIRLNAYNSCIYSAIEIDDNESKQFCYSRGIALANTYDEEQARAGWSEALDSTYNQTEPAIDEDDDDVSQ